MFDAITAAQLAMDLDQFKLQSINNNIANMNTPAFKKQQLELTEFNNYLQPQASALIEPLKNTTIHTQGTLNQTQRMHDIALSGEGYFQVQNENGLFYTRRGDFQINANGELATATGEVVLGKNGTLKIDDGNVTVDKEGRLFIDSRPINQFNIVSFDNPNQLIYAGHGLYQSTQAPIPSEPSTQILQGFLEQSNVKSMDEMMDMIKISRHFEMSQKIMRAADSLLSSAINQLGEGNV